MARSCCFGHSSNPLAGAGLLGLAGAAFESCESPSLLVSIATADEDDEEGGSDSEFVSPISPQELAHAVARLAAFGRPGNVAGEEVPMQLDDAEPVIGPALPPQAPEQLSSFPDACFDTSADEYRCAICLCVPRRPVELRTCGHVHCDECLRKHIAHSRAVEHRPWLSVFRCPTCREHFTANAQQDAGFVANRVRPSSIGINQFLCVTDCWLDYFLLQC